MCPSPLSAFYYYNPLQNQSYEATFLAVQQYFHNEYIPYRHLELDSFWYYKATGGGVVNWTAMPSAFPSGLVAFQQKIHLNFTAHNRWWSPCPTYAKQCGGQYDWIVETAHSVPTDAHFWPDLFANASQWGLRVYEQDWLGTEFADTLALHTQIGLARQWLMQMGEGAWGAGKMIIQYCGPQIRHILQSVEIEAVRQSRASADYEPGNVKWDNWDIRYTSLLFYALGVAPYKDTWWSSSSQPGNIYAVGYEPEPDLQALIAALSAGPVLPGDAIGRSNVTLINMTCRADGLLLKPDRPAFPTDADFIGMAFDPTYNRTVGRSSTTFTSYTTAGGDYTLLMNLRALHDCNRTSSSATPSPLPRTVRQLYLEAGIHPTAESAVVTLHYSDGLHRAARMQGISLPRYHHLRMDEPVPELLQPLPACGYVYLRASPCMGQLCVMGEMDKWVSMSKQRVVRFAQNATGAELELEGLPGEMVHVSYGQPGGAGGVLVADCRLGRSGTAVLTFRVSTRLAYTCSSEQKRVEEGEEDKSITISLE